MSATLDFLKGPVQMRSLNRVKVVNLPMIAIE